MKSIALIFISILIANHEGFAQATMAEKQVKSILLVNGTAHLGNGKFYPKSLIGLKEGKIVEVYNANIVNADNLKYDIVYDMSGKHIYPGFIAPNSSLGLREIDAVRATHDFQETGNMNPNARSIVAYNTDSKLTPTIRSNGVLLAQVAPRGGLISGTSSIVELDGWTWEEAVYVEDDGMHVNWPTHRLEDPNSNREKKDTVSAEEKRRQVILMLEQFFMDANAYIKSSFNYEINLRFESMRKLMEGKQSLYVHANHIKELSEAIAFKRNLGIQKMVVVGGSDAWRIPEMFVDNSVAIILQRIHSLPERSDEDVDINFRMPKILNDAGVLFCLENSGDMEVMGTRNLPFYAGTARAYGLEAERAVQIITLDAAKILGIDTKVGSIEVGKDATIIVSTGDALDIMTNNIEKAFIQGREINLNNEQKELYEKYSKKYQISD